MRHWLIGTYKTNNVVVFFVSIGFFLLGAISVFANGIKFFANLKNSIYDIENIAFFMAAIPPFLSIVLFYILAGVKRIFVNKLVSIPMTAYTIFFYITSTLSSPMPYLMFLLCFILLYNSFENQITRFSGVIVVWIISIIITIKLFSISGHPRLLTLIEIAKADSDGWAIILCIIMSGMFCGLLWLFATEIGERQEIKKQLHNIDLTELETKITMLYLLRHTPDEIANRLNKDKAENGGDPKNFLYQHHRNLKKKLNINHLSREKILEALSRKK